MKILFIIPYYIPAYSYGGPVKVAHDLAKAFVQKGHSVTVATTDVYDARSRNSVKNEEIDGVKIVRFRNLSNYLAKNFNGYLPFGFRKWIKNNLKNYDIVHCHDFFTYQNIVVSKYCKKFNVPFVVQPHGCLDAIRLKVKSLKFKVWFLKFFPILQNAKAVIALTEYEKESIASVIPVKKKVSLEGDTEGVETARNSLNSLHSFKSNTPLPPPFSVVLRRMNQGGLKQKNKIHIIPNGIQTAEFKNVKKVDLREKYKLSSETKLLFYFGRVQYIKGIDFVIKTLSYLPSPNSHLFIVGPDEDGEKARLEKLIRELKLEQKVSFVGQLTGDEKNNFLASCDLFLFLSRGEGLPMTILEVSALGVPSMLSKECFVPEIAQAGGGYEVDKENFEKNAELIVKHFSDETKIEKMRENAKKVVEGKFELEVVVGKMLELYRN